MKGHVGKGHVSDGDTTNGDTSIVCWMPPSTAVSFFAGKWYLLVDINNYYMVTIVVYDVIVRMCLTSVYVLLYTTSELHGGCNYRRHACLSKSVNRRKLTADTIGLRNKYACLRCRRDVTGLVVTVMCCNFTNKWHVSGYQICFTRPIDTNNCQLWCFSFTIRPTSIESWTTYFLTCILTLCCRPTGVCFSWSTLWLYRIMYVFVSHKWHGKKIFVCRREWFVGRGLVRSVTTSEWLVGRVVRLVTASEWCVGRGLVRSVTASEWFVGRGL